MTARIVGIVLALALLASATAAAPFTVIPWQPPIVTIADPGAQGLSAEARAAGDKALLDSASYVSDRALFDEAYGYFRQVAFAIEYGSAEQRLKRWQMPIQVTVKGEYTDADYAVFEQLVHWLNQIDGMPAVTITSEPGNHEYWFYPLEDLEARLENYPPGNWGVTYIWWDGSGQMTQGIAAVSTDVTNQEQRNHLIQEEFIQSLGLLQDSYDYADSIFQQAWTETQHPIAIDFAMLRFLYSPALNMSMNADQAYEALLSYYGLH